MVILSDIISMTVLFAVPLLLVALGGMFSERSGIINIALEGIMIIGALAGCLFMRAISNAPFAVEAPQFAMLLTILVSALCGALFSLLLAFASINLRADQTIGGTALNMLAPAFAVVLTWAIQGQGQTTILIPTWARISLQNFSDGFVGSIFGADAGTRFFEALDGTFVGNLFFKSFYLTTPIAFVLLIAAIIVMYRTKLGLRLRSCGEHPQAADSVGINVYKMRYTGVFISGLLGGIGGIAYTMAAGAGFQSTVAGYGFLALAVMIFGNWKPLNILGASFFFALFKVIGSYSSSIPFLPSFENVAASDYIYQMLPYIVTMIILVLTSKKSRAPKAEGIPYDKGAR